jgi:hypothetical protein
MTATPRQYKVVERLKSRIGDVLNPNDAYEENQKKSLTIFLEGLRMSYLKAERDFDLLIAGAKFGEGGTYGRESIGASFAEDYAGLSHAEQEEVRDYYLQTLNSLKLKFPEILNQFPEQF